MGDFIQLQNLGKSPHENQSRINSQTVTITLRKTTIFGGILTIIFATILLTSIYIIHFKEKNVEVPVSTFRRVASEDWNLSNESKEKIKKPDDDEFQTAVVNYERRNSKYNKTLQDYGFIGIDFGESFVTSFVYANEQLQQSARYRSYVGFEKYEGNQDNLRNVIARYDNPLPIFYDLKEIIRAWNSFHTSSDKLFWTFNIQRGPDGRPSSMYSPETGIHHLVESVLAKLFQRVKNATGESFYNDTTRSVITVPFDFTVDQRNMILDASSTAGFQEVALLDEDIAAALTLQYVKGPWSAAKTIMFLEFNQLSWKIYILVGHQSNFTRIDSTTFSETQDVVNFCINEYCLNMKCDQDRYKYDGSIKARIRYRRLYDECENATLYLSQNPHVEYYPISGLSAYSRVYIHRNDTDGAIQKQAGHFTHFIDATLRQRHVNLTKEWIDEVILGGKYGNFRMVKDTISRYFNGRNLTINDVSPDNTVAFGAAVKGLELTAEAIKRSRVNGTVV